jgi:hypothetical protein
LPLLLLLAREGESPAVEPAPPKAQIGEMPGNVRRRASIPVPLLSPLLYNVEGGHRSIVFNRLEGIKDKVTPIRPPLPPESHFSFSSS